MLEEKASEEKKVLEIISKGIKEPPALSVILEKAPDPVYANAQYLGICFDEEQLKKLTRKYDRDFVLFDNNLAEILKGKEFNKVAAFMSLENLDSAKRDEALKTIDDYVAEEGELVASFEKVEIASSTEDFLRSLGYEVRAYESEKLFSEGEKPVKGFWILQAKKKVPPSILRPAQSKHEKIRRFSRAPAFAKKVDYSKIISSELISIPEYKKRNGSIKENVLVNLKGEKDKVDKRLLNLLNLISNYNNLHTFELERAFKDKINSEAAFDTYFEQDGYITTKNFIKKFLIQNKIKNLGKILEYGEGPGAPALKGILEADVAFDSYVGIDLCPYLAKKNKELFDGVKAEFRVGAVPYTTFSEELFDTIIGTFFFNCLTRAERYATIAQLNTKLRPGGRIIISIPATNADYKEISEELEDLLSSIGFKVYRERKKLRLELENNRFVDKRIYIIEGIKEKDIDTWAAAKAYTGIAYLEVNREEQARALYENLDKLKEELSRIDNIKVEETANGYRVDFGLRAGLEELGALVKRDPLEYIKEALEKKYSAGQIAGTIEILRKALENGGYISGVDIIDIYRKHGGRLSTAPFAYDYNGDHFPDVFKVEKLAGLPVHALTDRLLEKYKEEKRVHKIKLDW